MATAGKSDGGCVGNNGRCDNPTLNKDMLRRRQKMIQNGMTYKFQNVLIIWSPTTIVRPDVVVTILSSHDRNVVVRNRWISAGSQSSQKIWGGAVAIFSADRSTSVWTTRTAALDIIKRINTLNAIWFPFFANHLIDVESNHPDFGSKFSCVLISGKRSFDKNHQFEVEMELHKFGTIEHLQFIDDKREYGVICEVYYAYVTQAVVAKVIMNDKFFSRIGRISTEVEGSPLEEDIIAKTMNRIMIIVKHISTNRSRFRAVGTV